MVDFRIYVQVGCPHCEIVKDAFAGIPLEVIVVGTDPVATAGLQIITKQRAAPVPVIISFLTNEIILGNKPEEISRVIDLYRRTRK